MNDIVTSRHAIEQIYRDHSRRVLAALIRLLNDFNLAEECLQEAFIAALRVTVLGLQLWISEAVSSTLQ